MYNARTPQQVQTLLRERPDCQLIDVREYAEYAGGHVPGATLISLGSLPTRLAEVDKARPAVLLCKSGKRATQAAQLLCANGCQEVLVVEGGTEAWIAAGLPVDKEARAPWALERQVRLAAGLLILGGLFIPPWPYLSAFVGAGLTFAALTNTCAMGLMLSKMPWNRPRNGVPAVACSRT
jgi:rhodanese-related sulfurtransferase